MRWIRTAVVRFVKGLLSIISGSGTGTDELKYDSVTGSTDFQGVPDEERPDAELPPGYYEKEFTTADVLEGYCEKEFISAGLQDRSDENDFESGDLLDGDEDDDDDSEWNDYEPFDGMAIEIPIDDFIDLHTFSPDETLDALDAWLEAARTRGYRRVRIIHGRGRGVQRRMVQSFLSRHYAVIRYHDADPSEGGWGATIAHLK